MKRLSVLMLAALLPALVACQPDVTPTATVMNPDGTGLQQLTNNDANDDTPFWRR
jgi:hypothetical protein